MNKNNYSLEILVNSRPVKEYYHKEKVFIEARKDYEYTLKFRNNNAKRVMAIFSVDGLEVLEGKEAAKAETGYIIEPFSSLDIKGFRIDENSVAAFKFNHTELSYSNTQGYAVENPVTKQTDYIKTTKNNGTIGVRVFEEKPVSVAPVSSVSYYNLVASGCSPSSFASYATGTFFDNILISTSVSFPPHHSQSQYSAQVGALRGKGMSAGPITEDYFAPVPNFDIGTSLGSRLTDKVKEVAFNRAETFVELEIYYASRESLINYGIDFSNTKQIVAWPQAFEEKKKYCKMPDWYKG